MPDDNSASLQSYNDARTGIWFQESAYGVDTNYPIMTDIQHDGGTESVTTPLLPQRVQQVLTNADDATPFLSEPGSPLYGRAPAMSAGLGNERREEMTAPSLLLPATSETSVPQFIHHPYGIRLGATSVIDRNLDPEAQHRRDHHSSFPLGGPQDPLQNIVPTIASNNLALPAITVQTTISTGPSDPTPTPRVSTNTSTSGVARCTHKECRAKFKSMDSLRRHNRLVHRDGPKLRCPQCNVFFQSGRPDNLKRHFASKHPGHPLPAWLKVRPRRSPLTTSHHVTRRERRRT